MNKKSYIIICILLVSGLCIFTGCSAGQGEKYTVEDLDNLAEIRIYYQNDGGGRRYQSSSYSRGIFNFLL